MNSGASTCRRRYWRRSKADRAADAHACARAPRRSPARSAAGCPSRTTASSARSSAAPSAAHGTPARIRCREISARTAARRRRDSRTRKTVPARLASPIGIDRSVDGGERGGDRRHLEEQGGQQVLIGEADANASQRHRAAVLADHQAKPIRATTPNADCSACISPPPDSPGRIVHSAARCRWAAMDAWRERTFSVRAWPAVLRCSFRPARSRYADRGRCSGARTTQTKPCIRRPLNTIGLVPRRPCRSPRSPAEIARSPSVPRREWPSKRKARHLGVEPKVDDITRCLDGLPCVRLNPREATGNSMSLVDSRREQIFPVLDAAAVDQ